MKNLIARIHFFNPFTLNYVSEGILGVYETRWNIFVSFFLQDGDMCVRLMMEKLKQIKLYSFSSTDLENLAKIQYPRRTSNDISAAHCMPTYFQESGLRSSSSQPEDEVATDTVAEKLSSLDGTHPLHPFAWPLNQAPSSTPLFSSCTPRQAVRMYRGNDVNE